jgi:hypothetical protein
MDVVIESATIVEMAGGVIAGGAVAAALNGEVIDAVADVIEIDIVADIKRLRAAAPGLNDVGPWSDHRAEFADGIGAQIRLKHLHRCLPDNLPGTGLYNSERNWDGAALEAELGLARQEPHMIHKHGLRCGIGERSRRTAGQNEAGRNRLLHECAAGRRV